MRADLVDIFFYGLFMDRALLESRGLTVSQMQRASLDGYALRVGKRATLVPEAGAVAHGVHARMSAEDLRRLYSDPGVVEYRPETVRVRLEDGSTIAASCYVAAPASGQDPQYAAKLRALAQRLGLPESYVKSIS